MKRWLLVGDSFAWGYGVEQDQTLDAVLEARHADLEFINAGVAGYGTDQQYLYLKHRGLELAPDVVVLLLHPNDLRNNAFARQYGYPKPYFRLAKEPSGRDRLHLEGTPVPAPSWSTRAERYLLRHTYFPRRVLLFLDELGDAPRPVTPAAEAQALTRRLLLAILDIVRGQGAELAVVNVPWDDPVTSGRIASLSRAVERQGGTWISLREAFAKARGETMFPHNQHWNAYGQRLAALEIERVLLASEPLQTGEVGGRESRK